MEKAVDDGMLYVLYHSEMEGIDTVPDYYGKELTEVTSPIALFARTQSGDLKVVAIQMADNPASLVYTPLSSTHDWMQAKVRFFFSFFF